MLEIGSQMLVGLPGPTKFHTLQLGCVLEMTDGGYTVEFELEEIPADMGQTGHIFFQAETGFCQQSIRIEEIVEGAPIPTIRLSTIGDPVSAEGRQHPRISTVASELISTLGDEEFCPVIDLSKSGFAVLSSEVHEVGDIVEVTIENGPDKYSGNVCVQSSKELWEGRFRYGVYCCDSDDSNGTLKNGLAAIAADLLTVID